MPKAKPIPAARVPAKPVKAPTSKIETLIALMRRPEGATIDALIKASGWQAHSVRGAIAGTIKKKRRLVVSSALSGQKRVYRIDA